MIRSSIATRVCIVRTCRTLVAADRECPLECGDLSPLCVRVALAPPVSRTRETLAEPVPHGHYLSRWPACRHGSCEGKSGDKSPHSKLPLWPFRPRWAIVRGREYDRSPRGFAWRIVIGTDEAGYGPNYGPLVIAASVWEVPEGVTGANLYKRLHRVIAPAADAATVARPAWRWPTRNSFTRRAKGCGCWNGACWRPSRNWIAVRPRAVACGGSWPPSCRPITRVFLA